MPPERLLAAGLPVLPLAPVSQVSSEQLPGVLRAVAERLRNEAAPELKATLWAATEILLGLYHPNERVQELTKEVTAMILGIRGIEESSVYQDIFAKGEAKGRAEAGRGRGQGPRRGRGRGGEEDLAPPGPEEDGTNRRTVLALVAGINDPDRLNRLLDRILDVATWEELLATADS